MSPIRKFAPGLALCLSAASALSQVSQVEEPLRFPISENQPFSGELEHSFDSAFNRTTARFSASLRSRNIFLDFFLGAPDVHTLVASYDFPGRRLVDPPDSVRITLYSHELIQADLDYSPPRRRNPNLVLAFGDRVAFYPLGIAEKSEDVVTPDPAFAAHWREDLTADVSSQGAGQLRQVHIERTATAWIPTRDFLRLVSVENTRGEVAGLEFQLSETVMFGLRELAAQMNRQPAVRTGFVDDANDGTRSVLDQSFSRLARYHK